MSESILWGNTLDQITHNEDYSHIFEATDCIVQGGRAGAGNLILNAKLALLADNGGPTQTHGLMRGSEAIDALEPSLCPAIDQRGVGRPIDDNADGVEDRDMGAYMK